MKAFLIFCAFIFAIMCGLSCLSSSIQHNRKVVHELNEKIEEERKSI